MDKTRQIDPSPSKPGSTAHLQHETAGRTTTVDSIDGAKDTQAK